MGRGMLSPGGRVRATTAHHQKPARGFLQRRKESILRERLNIVGCSRTIETHLGASPSHARDHQYNHKTNKTSLSLKAKFAGESDHLLHSSRPTHET